jgi:GxxExxY protein
MAPVFEVHNHLGPGFLEKVYGKALSLELKSRGLSATSQSELSVYYKNQQVGVYVADFVVNDVIILELKSVDKLAKIHEAQILNYLKCTDLRLGILVNFGIERVEYKRFAL